MPSIRRRRPWYRVLAPLRPKALGASLKVNAKQRRACRRTARYIKGFPIRRPVHVFDARPAFDDDIESGPARYGDDTDTPLACVVHPNGDARAIGREVPLWGHGCWI